MQLNKEQQAAVKSDAKRILTVAGPGTGKTRVLTHRIERMVKNRGESPLSVLALTFTRKAAGEMAERLSGMLTLAEVRKMRIGTFHSVALQIVREWGDLLGYKENLSIYDQVDQLDIIKSIISDFGLKVKVKDVLEVMQHRAERKIPAHAKELDVKPVLDQYQNTLRRYNALDYQGLLDTAVMLMRIYPEVRKHYHNQWRLVFVDEYQDTDIVQWEFLELLDPDQLFVVGDYRQSIYGWRGARPDLLMQFAKIATRFDLVKNYRSLPGIIEHANGIISSKKYGEPLVSTRESKNDNQVHCGAFDGLMHEGMYIVDQVITLVSHTSPGYQYRDIAILARKNRQLALFSQWLRDSQHDLDVPHVRIGAKMEFWKSEPARVCAQVLKLINNPHDNQSLRSILKILNILVPDLKTLEWQARKANKPLVEVLPENNPVRRGYELINREDLESHPADLVFMSFCGECDIREHYLERRLTTKAGQVETFADRLTSGLYSIEDFLDWYNFREVDDELEEAEDQDRVKLMTVHAAKGLEFPVVIVLGCTDDDFPAKKGDMEEERRLFYVAATRPKDRLYLICPLMDERGKPKKPSRFLASRKGPVCTT